MAAQYSLVLMFPRLATQLTARNWVDMTSTLQAMKDGGVKVLGQN